MRRARRKIKNPLAYFLEAKFFQYMCCNQLTWLDEAEELNKTGHGEAERFRLDSNRKLSEQMDEKI